VSRPGGRPARALVEAVLVALLLAVFARAFVVQAFRIPTGSMEPALRVGEHLLVDRFAYGATLWSWERRWLPLRAPRRGDVIVFRYPRDPSRIFVKRVLALPGEQVAMEMRRVAVDGRPVDERGWARYVDPSAYPDSGLLDAFYRRRDNFGPARVPADAYFVLGDNRDVSADSRFWGFVPQDLVLGRAIAVYLSPRRETGAPRSGVPWRDVHLLRLVR